MPGSTSAEMSGPVRLRPETVQRAFYLWGEINREYVHCRDPQTKSLLKARRDGIVNLVRRNVEAVKELTT